MFLKSNNNNLSDVSPNRGWIRYEATFRGGGEVFVQVHFAEWKITHNFQLRITHTVELKNTHNVELRITHNAKLRIIHRWIKNHSQRWIKNLSHSWIKNHSQLWIKNHSQPRQQRLIGPLTISLGTLSNSGDLEKRVRPAVFPLSCLSDDARDHFLTQTATSARPWSVCQ